MPTSDPTFEQTIDDLFSLEEMSVDDISALETSVTGGSDPTQAGDSEKATALPAAPIDPVAA